MARGEVFVTCPKCTSPSRIPISALKHDNYHCSRCGTPIPLASAIAAEDNTRPQPSGNRPRRPFRRHKRRQASQQSQLSIKTISHSFFISDRRGLTTLAFKARNFNRKGYRHFRYRCLKAIQGKILKYTRTLSEVLWRETVYKGGRQFRSTSDRAVCGKSLTFAVEAGLYGYCI